MSDSKRALALPERSISLGNPTELSNFANELKKFIVEQKLFTNIKGKNYVNVEGWQLAGAVTGVMPVVRQLKCLNSESEIKYRAEVELIQISTDKVVGYGIAICSDKEGNRKGSDEYVIASMAQTRATGKAYRNCYAWLMKMAGYETTPAEEAPKLVVEIKEKTAKEVAEVKNKTSKLAEELLKDGNS